MAETPAPSPGEIFDRAVEEGTRRLDQSLLELISTSFIAGFTIVFGIVALGIVEALVEPQFGEVAKIAGALAFGVGLVFVVVGRTELFNENFFDPVAAAADRSGTWMLSPLLRLWALTLVFNLLGGGLFALVFSVDGVLPSGTGDVLAAFAKESARHGPAAWFSSAVAGGALVSLLSFLLVAVNSVRTRLSLAYIVGFLLALGPLNHVVVTALHVFFGILFGANIGLGTLAVMIVVVTIGNLLGGLGLVTLTHVTQAMGARNAGE
ncbi:formate/nitrite transporter family protein [Halomarina pelagica]|uniref:formate/nitrite transporter family protein n=1 Tax=Halomarina pelagica TaxID=2961599 RepID=UPI0020C47820|nr:formate/nitrite transporter family protein [Halomarina sp. BND7]